MKKKINRKGFTMVELLATVVILGILSVVAITSVSKLVTKSKETHDKQLKRTLVMAAKSYLETNSSKFPKEIGQGRRIYAFELKDKKYLKGDFNNSKGKECVGDKNNLRSYVLVRKVSKTKYTYDAYIYCGDEPADDIKNVAPPKISIKFNDNVSNGTISDLVNAKLTISINARGINDSDENVVPLDGYSFSIATVTKENTDEQQDEREVYNSGSVSVRNQKNVTITKPLTDYLDVSKVTKITVKVVARNVDGGYSSVSKTVGAEGETGPTVNYVDNVLPICGEKVGEASDTEPWVNAASGKKERKVSVSCNDGNGSGCIRDTFTKTWPNDETPGGEYDYVMIEDNAGNKRECPVKIKIDVTYPKINIEAYKKDSSGAPTGGSVFTDDVARTVGGSSKLEEARATVQNNQYKNLSNNWMNKKNYSSGVVYKVTLTEESPWIKWEWNTGSGDSQSGILGENDLKQDNNTRRYSTKKDLYLTFTEEGARTGTLTVTDMAGNVSQIVINAQIDTTPPTCKIKLSKDTPDGKNGWYKSSVSVNLIKDDTGSGIGDNYSLTSIKGKKYNKRDHYDITNNSGIIYYAYVKDNAGNTAESKTDLIKVDTTAPVISNVNLDGDKGDNGWYKNNVTSTLKATENGSGIDKWRYVDTPQIATGYVHVQFNGNLWTGEQGTKYIGTKALGRNLEAFILFVRNHTSTKGSIKYCINGTYKDDASNDVVNNICDKSDDQWIKEGNQVGIGGHSNKITKIGFKFTGDLAEYFNLKYKVYRKYETENNVLEFENGAISDNLYSDNPHYVEGVEFEITPKNDTTNGLPWKETKTSEKSFEHKFVVEQETTNYFQVCDKAGNCSPIEKVPIKIDNTPPIKIARNILVDIGYSDLYNLDFFLPPVNNYITEDPRYNINDYGAKNSKFWVDKEDGLKFKGFNDLQYNTYRDIPNGNNQNNCYGPNLKWENGKCVEKTGILRVVKWQFVDNLSGMLQIHQEYPACPPSACGNDNDGGICKQTYKDDPENNSLFRYHETFGNYGNYSIGITDEAGNTYNYNDIYINRDYIDSDSTCKDP